MLKYEPLGQYLRLQTEDVLHVSLEQISQIVGALPVNAATAQFWANTRHHYSRRRSWLDAGFRAFFEPPGHVRFERYEKSSSAWSLKELRACVEAYKKLIDAQIAGQILNKSELRRSVLLSLEDRTDSSYEYRMQNISAVMEKLGLPLVIGYPPARNVGGVVEAIIELVVDIFDRKNETETPTVDEQELIYRSRAAQVKYASDPNKRPPKGSLEPQRGTMTAAYVKRDPEVSGWVRYQADGKCEACGEDAPFEDEVGLPFLEVHHVRPLAEGGPDTTDNTAALCPNCHRAFHRAQDAGGRRRELLKRVTRLVDYPKELTTL